MFLTRFGTRNVEHKSGSNAGSPPHLPYVDGGQHKARETAVGDGCPPPGGGLIVKFASQIK